MRKFLTLISAAAILATPAFAQARGFNSNFSQAIPGPFKLEVVVSEDLAHRANNLPKDIRDRASRSIGATSFSNNGNYGDQEIEFLLREMTEDIVHDFDKRGLTLSDDATTLLRVTIVEVKPNRATHKQRQEEPGQSFLSVGTGGADVSAEFVAASGTVVGTASYDFYTTLTDGFPLSANGTWTDARRSFSKFSRKLSKKVAEQSKAGS